MTCRTILLLGAGEEFCFFECLFSLLFVSVVAIERNRISLWAKEGSERRRTEGGREGRKQVFFFLTLLLNLFSTFSTSTSNPLFFSPSPAPSAPRPRARRVPSSAAPSRRSAAPRSPPTMSPPSAASPRTETALGCAPPRQRPRAPPRPLAAAAAALLLRRLPPTAPRPACSPPKPGSPSPCARRPARPPSAPAAWGAA